MSDALFYDLYYYIQLKLFLSREIGKKWNIIIFEIGGGATYTFFILLFRFFIYLYTDEAVLNIITQASGFTKFIFIGWKTRNSMSSPIPGHENNRVRLFEDKFVIVEAILNIMLQVTAFASLFCYRIATEDPHSFLNVPKNPFYYINVGYYRRRLMSN